MYEDVRLILTIVRSRFLQNHVITDYHEELHEVFYLFQKTSVQ